MLKRLHIRVNRSLEICSAPSPAITSKPSSRHLHASGPWTKASALKSKSHISAATVLCQGAVAARRLSTSEAAKNRF